MQSWKSENEVGRDRRFHACHVDRGAEPTEDTAYPFTLAFADFALFVASAKTGVYSVDIKLNLSTQFGFIVQELERKVESEFNTPKEGYNG